MHDNNFIVIIIVTIFRYLRRYHESSKQKVSNALFQAYISKEPIEFVSKTYNLTEPEAYKTQDDLIHQIQAEKNVPVKGYKVSMTSLCNSSNC